jgi:quercetin dioxygenase-like cupin family protein
MAYKGKQVFNPQTGQHIRFLKTARHTSGQLLEMETTYDPFSKEPLTHYHPRQEEDFTVIAGELTVKINGELRILKAGDKLHIPQHTHHAMWNNSSQTTVVNWQVRPALDTEYLLETANGLAADGKINAAKPSLLQTAILLNKFGQVFRLSKPPAAVQKILFCMLTPFAWLAGYRAVYRKYID